MKLSKSRLLDIIREEMEAEMVDVDEGLGSWLKGKWQDLTSAKPKLTGGTQTGPPKRTDSEDPEYLAKRQRERDVEERSGGVSALPKASWKRHTAPHWRVNQPPVPFTEADERIDVPQEVADTGAPAVAGGAMASSALKKGVPLSRLGSKVIKTASKAALPGAAADLAGNLAVAPIAQFMSRVRDATGTEPIWPEGWKETVADKIALQRAQGEEPSIALEIAKAAFGLERDIDFKRLLPGLAHMDAAAAATGRVPGGGGTLTGPGWTQADADDYYAAQAEADELGDGRDDGDVPPEDLDALQETLTRWQKIIKS